MDRCYYICRGSEKNRPSVYPFVGGERVFFFKEAKALPHTANLKMVVPGGIPDVER